MSKKILMLIIITVLGFVGYVSYRQFGQRYGKSMDAALEQEEELHQERIEELEEQVYSLEEELGKQETDDQGAKDDQQVGRYVPRVRGAHGANGH